MVYSKELKGAILGKVIPLNNDSFVKQLKKQG